MSIDEITEMKGDFSSKLLICPYCPPKPKTSHRTASYKVKITKTDLLVMRCKACNKSLKVQVTGDFIFREEHIEAFSKEEYKNE